MRSPISLLTAGAVVALITVGCAGPEAKLGRGVSNSLEFGRMGEMRYSIEQASLFDGPSAGFTTGVIRGFNRSVARTLAGAYEIATFPLPSYDPIYKPVKPVYPDSFKPGRSSDAIFETDTALGFSGGDVAPVIPGSRFRIFDY